MTSPSRCVSATCPIELVASIAILAEGVAGTGEEDGTEDEHAQVRAKPK